MLKNYFLGSNTYKGFSGEFSHLLDGRAVILKGGAGSGKSTLLHLLVGEDLPDNGQILRKENF